MFKKLYLLFLLCISCHTVSVTDKDLATFFLKGDKFQSPSGFEKLFNGKNFSGWHGVLKSPNDNPYKEINLIKNNKKNFLFLQKKANDFMNRHWSIDNEVLAFDGKGFSIGTNKKYDNFELYVSWKIVANADSGLYLKGTPQIQIWDVNSKKSQKYGSAKGSGGLWNNSKTKQGRFPLVVADNAIGQWNHFFVRMLNDRVTVYLNGQCVVKNALLENYWKRGKKLLKRGEIQLQAHGSKVWFKNIYIREIQNIKE